VFKALPVTPCCLTGEELYSSAAGSSAWCTFIDGGLHSSLALKGVSSGMRLSDSGVDVTPRAETAIYSVKTKDGFPPVAGLITTRAAVVSFKYIAQSASLIFYSHVTVHLLYCCSKASTWLTQLSGKVSSSPSSMSRIASSSRPALMTFRCRIDFITSNSLRDNVKGVIGKKS